MFSIVCIVSRYEYPKQLWPPLVLYLFQPRSFQVGEQLAVFFFSFCNHNRVDHKILPFYENKKKLVFLYYYNIVVEERISMALSTSSCVSPLAVLQRTKWSCSKLSSFAADGRSSRMTNRSWPGWALSQARISSARLVYSDSSSEERPSMVASDDDDDGNDDDDDDDDEDDDLVRCLLWPRPGVTPMTSDAEIPCRSRM